MLIRQLQLPMTHHFIMDHGTPLTRIGSTTFILSWRLDICDKARIFRGLGEPSAHSFEVFYSVLDTSVESVFWPH